MEAGRSVKISSCLALLFCVVWGAAPAVAQVGVLLPGTQPADGDGDPAFPVFRNGANPGVLDDPGVCSSCHGGYRLAGEPVYEPYDSWAGSLMAMAGRDPLFWASLDIANQDDAVLGDVDAGDLCLRCHAPKGWYEGRSDCATPWGEMFDGSCLEGSQDADDNDFEGVQCHFCHRMYDASVPPPGEHLDPSAPYGENGQVYLTTDPDTMQGPYSDADPPGRHGFDPSPFHRGSAFCGECHDVTNPARHRRDPLTGADLGYPMPVERTYSEHLQSGFARPGSGFEATCQDCHMPPPDLDGDGAPDPAFACQNPPGPRGTSTALEGPVWTHSLRGGGAWMIGVLAGEYGAALGREEYFQAAYDASLDLLAGAAEVALTLPPEAETGASFDAVVRVTNHAGHKLPTGYPEGRRAWIHVEAGEDLDGSTALEPAEVTYESAAYDPATGVLDHGPEARVYELKIGVWDWNGTGECDLTDGAAGPKMFHFVLNDCVLEDNRIPPRGFVPGEETAPVGHTYPEDPAIPGALAHWDDTTYQVPVPAGAAKPFRVRATLLYQTTSREYVEFLLQENRSTCDPFDAGCDPTQPNPGPNRGEKMHALWEAYGRSAPVVLGSAAAAVPVREPAPSAPGEASNPRRLAPLRVSRRGPASGDLQLSYDPACDGTDHSVYWGPLAEVGSYNYTGVACNVGIAGDAVVTPGEGSQFLLVVGNNGLVEGPYGLDSTGAQRPEDQATPGCDYPLDLTATCE